MVAQFSRLRKMFLYKYLDEGGIPMWIFRTWTTTRDGERIYAKDYGKRAFRIWIDSKNKK